MEPVSNNDKQVGIWLLIGIGMIFFQVLLGGITRLTGSGLSITEWNVVLGTFPPLNDSQWMEAFQKYQHFPQFHLVNSDMTLHQFKWIFFWEYVHRLWARTLGLVFILPLIYFWVSKKIKLHEVPKYFALFLLGGAQGVLGWVMVKSGLVDMPWVEPTKLTAHLLLASVLYLITLRFALEKLTPKQSKYYPKYMRANIFFLLILILIQITLGGMVAGWKAALPYNTWPKMEGKWVPDNLFSMAPVWRNFLENKLTLQFFHRLTAYTIFAYVIFIYTKAVNMPVPKLFKRGKHIMLGLVILQLLLGIATVLHSLGHVPVKLGVMHQGVAFLLLMTVFSLHYWFKYREA